LKSYIIAESIMMPAYKITERTMTGKEAGSEIDTVPVSYNTTSRRVDDVT
jgi:hypothetical protein